MMARRKPPLLCRLLMNWLSYQRKDVPDYMQRFVFWEPTWWRPGLRIHHILCSDPEVLEHDHPWWFISLIVSNGYIEWINNKAHWREPADVLFRKATHKHRLELEPNTTTWTIVLHGRKQQTWKFYLGDEA